MVKKKNDKKRPIAGFFGVSGCAGCLLSVLYEDSFEKLDSLLDIKAFPLIRENTYDGNFDIVFIEGTVVFEKDVEVVKKLREKSGAVVALGACAVVGGVPSIKNFRNEDEVMRFVYPKADHLKSRKPEPIHKHIKVDYFLPQCPPNKDEVIDFIVHFANGTKFRNYRDPVCVECRKKGNLCLLDIGELCLGPVANGGCNALCPSNGVGCYGCRGACKDANYDAFKKMLLDMGYTEKVVKEKMETFSGLDFEEEAKEEMSVWLEK